MQLLLPFQNMQISRPNRLGWRIHIYCKENANEKSLREKVLDDTREEQLYNTENYQIMNMKSITLKEKWENNYIIVWCPVLRWKYIWQSHVKKKRTS